MLLCLDIVVVVEAVLSQHLFHFLMWARGDLVDHRPGESDLGLIFQVGEEVGRHQSVGYPLLCVSEDTCLHLVAVV